MKLTLQDLKDHHACESGQQLFLELFPSGVLEVEEWGKGCQVGMLLHPQARTFWGWVVSEGLISAWSMSKQNFSNTDLSGADLSGADLSGANLYRAGLSGANLTNCIGYTKPT